MNKFTVIVYDVDDLREPWMAAGPFSQSAAESFVEQIDAMQQDLVTKTIPFANRNDTLAQLEDVFNREDEDEE